MARLRIEGVSKRYGEVVAIREVTLDVADGEFVVLLGPSGCGKTTTLRVVAGFVEPDSGSVELGSRDITWLPPWKRNAGLVFQSYALFPAPDGGAERGLRPRNAQKRRRRTWVAASATP
jgi:putative spermidine/putrescine transport system ATP-binding protein